MQVPFTGGTEQTLRELEEVDLELPELIRLLRRGVGFSEHEIGRVVDRSAATIRRWQRGDRLPHRIPESLEDLRTITREMLAAGLPPRLITSWATSRNVALGQDRPLDALRVGEFRRAEYAATCLVEARAAEPGPLVVPLRAVEPEPSTSRRDGAAPVPALVVGRTESDPAGRHRGMNKR